MTMGKLLLCGHTNISNDKYNHIYYLIFVYYNKTSGIKIYYYIYNSMDQQLLYLCHNNDHVAKLFMKARLSGFFREICKDLNEKCSTGKCNECKYEVEFLRAYLDVVSSELSSQFYDLVHSGDSFCYTLVLFIDKVHELCENPELNEKIWNLYHLMRSF